uniref:Transmembrane protein n=1 Tax=Toxoplasma gondii (strain ATCC 50861 / VEG) TaxID=432359 RepID=A0A0F7V427_TOXGV|nr:TPA: hypothetical protein BN1205_093680 [Toxoplasma gondii VEG]
MGDSSKALARMMARFLACLLFASIMAPAWTSFSVASTGEDVSAGELVGEQTERPVISLPDVISDKPSAETAATEPALLRLTSTGEQTNIIAGEYISASEAMAAFQNGAESTSESALFEEKPLWLLYALKDSLVTEQVLQTGITTLCKYGSRTTTRFPGFVIPRGNPEASSGSTLLVQQGECWCFYLFADSCMQTSNCRRQLSRSRRMVYPCQREGRMNWPVACGIHVRVESTMNCHNRHGFANKRPLIAVADYESSQRLSHLRLVGRFLKREYDDGDLGYFSAVSGLACRAAVEGFLRAYEETRFAEEAVTSNGTAEVERAPWIPQLLSSTKVKRTFSLMRQQGRIFLTDARLMNMIFHIKAVTARLLRGSSAQRQFKNKATTFGYSTMCRRDCAEAITEHLSQTKIAPATSRKALQTDPLSRLQNDWRSIVLCNTGG